MARKAKGRRGLGRAELSFNHAMVYVRNLDRALRFYRDRLGFQVIEVFRSKGWPGYARLRSPGGRTTLALHGFDKGMDTRPSHSIRLYFEVRNLDQFCRRLAAAGVRFKLKPKLMPWGWRHAYLNDPDGHEVSLYWAGEKRLRASL